VETELLGDLEQLQQENAKVQKENLALENRLSDFEKVKKEKDHAEKENHNLRIRLADFEKVETEIKRAEEENSDLKQRLDKVETEKTRADNDLRISLANVEILMQENDQLKKAKLVLEKRLADLEQVRNDETRLKKLYESCKAESDKGKQHIDSLNAQISGLRQLYEAQTQRVEELTQMIKAPHEPDLLPRDPATALNVGSVDDGEVKLVQAEASALRDEVSRLKEQLKVVTGDIATKLTRFREAVEIKLLDLKTSFDADISAKAAAAESRYDSEKARIVSLRSAALAKKIPRWDLYEKDDHALLKQYLDKHLKRSLFGSDDNQRAALKEQYRKTKERNDLVHEYNSDITQLDAEAKMHGESLFDLDEQYARELDSIKPLAIGSSGLDALISEVRETFPGLLLSLPIPEHLAQR